MSRNVIETVLGAVVLLAAATFIMFAMQFSGGATVKGYDLIGEFRAIDGLKVGDEVRVAGVKVGTVTRAVLRPNDYVAVVTMRLEPDVLVSTDSSVAVHTDGLFGGKYLEIQVGGETTNMKNGDRFGFLQDSVIVEELIEKIVNYAEDQRKKAPAAEKAKP